LHLEHFSAIAVVQHQVVVAGLRDHHPERQLALKGAAEERLGRALARPQLLLADQSDQQLSAGDDADREHGAKRDVSQADVLGLARGQLQRHRGVGGRRQARRE
jgi:hypothetical protein